LGGLSVSTGNPESARYPFKSPITARVRTAVEAAGRTAEARPLVFRNPRNSLALNSSKG
jgi:hypothetical protein